MHTIETTTISLPRELARRARRVSKEESRSMSELFREAFRFYEHARERQANGLAFGNGVAWKSLRTSLLKISRAGKKQNLSAFIARDRAAH